MTLLQKDKLAAQIEGDLIALLDDWHSLPETWDSDLDAQIHRWYANPPRVYPKRPYFSPSSVNSCPRELYVKAKGGKRDEGRRQPHQGRWTRIGTQIGDIIQRDLLFIEKHYEKKTGNIPRFRFLRDKQGRPAFEDFAKINREVRIGDERFYLYGAPDGVMEYITDDGEKIRVGLEIKSKQTTPARTSLYSMRDAEESHIKQCIAYSYMFDCDYYVIMYVNAAKQRWELTQEQYEKTPDLRAFCYHITDNDRYDLLLQLADIQKAINEGTPPKMDVNRYTFNNFKTATVMSLTDAELAEIERYNNAMQSSSMPAWKKRGLADAVKDIKERRRTS